MERAKVILVDGLSGTGKGTSISYISNFFRTKGLNVHTFAEPSNFLGDFIRKYRQRPREERDVEVETILFTKDRQHLVETEITPLLDDSRNVIVSDRSFLSTCAYQSLQGMPLDEILKLNSFYPNPDLAFVFLCEPGEAFRRIIERGKPTLDETVQNIGRLRNSYDIVASRLPYTRKIIADGSIGAVNYQLRSHLNRLMGIEMNKAVFLDKDGTLVDNDGYPDVIPSDDIYFDKTVDGLIKLQEEEYKLIIVSSQPWVARGRLTEEGTRQIFESVVKQYGAWGINVDAFYYCLHARSEGCECKKPRTGLLEEAAERFNVDTTESYFVGDSEDDILTGRNFGLKTCLVKTGQGKDYDSNVRPDYISEDVNDFVRKLAL